MNSSVKPSLEQPLEAARRNEIRALARQLHTTGQLKRTLLTLTECLYVERGRVVARITERVINKRFVKPNEKAERASHRATIYRCLAPFEAAGIISRYRIKSKDLSGEQAVFKTKYSLYYINLDTLKLCVQLQKPIYRIDNNCRALSPKQNQPLTESSATQHSDVITSIDLVRDLESIKGSRTNKKMTDEVVRSAHASVDDASKYNDKNYWINRLGEQDGIKSFSLRSAIQELRASSSNIKNLTLEQLNRLITLIDDLKAVYSERVSFERYERLSETCAFYVSRIQEQEQKAQEPKAKRWGEDHETVVKLIKLYKSKSIQPKDHKQLTLLIFLLKKHGDNVQPLLSLRAGYLRYKHENNERFKRGEYVCDSAFKHGYTEAQARILELAQYVKNQSLDELKKLAGIVTQAAKPAADVVMTAAQNAAANYQQFVGKLFCVCGRYDLFENLSVEIQGEIAQNPENFK